MPERSADIGAGREIHTGGGAAVDGNVHTRDFTGRDNRNEVNVSQLNNEALTIVLTRLEIFDHRFEILNARLGEMLGMRGDMDDIKASVFRAIEVEPRMRQELSSMEQKFSFHFTLLWFVIGVLFVGMALTWLRG